MKVGQTILGACASCCEPPPCPEVFIQAQLQTVRKEDCGIGCTLTFGQAYTCYLNTFSVSCFGFFGCNLRRTTTTRSVNLSTCEITESVVVEDENYWKFINGEPYECIDESGCGTSQKTNEVTWAMLEAEAESLLLPWESTAIGGTARAVYSERNIYLSPKEVEISRCRWRIKLEEGVPIPPGKVIEVVYRIEWNPDVGATTYEDFTITIDEDDYVGEWELLSVLGSEGEGVKTVTIQSYACVDE